MPSIASAAIANGSRGGPPPRAFCRRDRTLMGTLRQRAFLTPASGRIPGDPMNCHNKVP
ncbi:hypothetical protein HBE99_00895 [Mycobacteroides chelonae]|uniref:hypothetical protein n=1 Tax=Mycobacteroides chelonae TaxID=1774 RepID=UPI001910DCD6|nr:hypothetical protein [Mycobacteroides chelonae]QQG95605.1 hypothetical protein HBE99_00895 [Mycobacteroides chelonae]